MGRYQGILRQDRLCLHCSSGKIEDEEHFLLHCVYFNEDRSDLINSINKNCPNFDRLQTTDKLDWLLNCEDFDILKILCCYLKKHFVYHD